MNEDMNRLREAIAFVIRYEGNFTFLKDMRKKVEAGEELTPNMISAILRCKARERPRVPNKPPEPAEYVDPGIYVKDDVIYKVQLTRDKKRKYAKRLVKIGGERLNENFDHVNWTYEYAPGVIHTLQPRDRMSIEDAKTFGLRYGICANCGRRLEQADSVELGIGPVCIKYFTF